MEITNDTDQDKGLPFMANVRTGLTVLTDHCSDIILTSCRTYTHIWGKAASMRVTAPLLHYYTPVTPLLHYYTITPYYTAITLLHPYYVSITLLHPITHVLPLLRLYYTITSLLHPIKLSQPITPLLHY